MLVNKLLKFALIDSFGIPWEMYCNEFLRKNNVILNKFSILNYSETCLRGHLNI